jgi:hypothetical protein
MYLDKLNIIWRFGYNRPNSIVANNQGTAGLDCWIVQYGLQSNLEDWIVIDNPKSKSDFRFGL